jgi:hypothetical protein
MTIIIQEAYLHVRLYPPASSIIKMVTFEERDKHDA